MIQQVPGKIKCTVLTCTGTILWSNNKQKTKQNEKTKSNLPAGKEETQPEQENYFKSTANRDGKNSGGKPC
jgi:hypothetical protein